ncbi:MAG: hypothetical protein LIO75_04345, partial [Lachnospiraceae bacterium]|nr:hypothetical protein [Lachnospiraceae bacterium]
MKKGQIYDGVAEKVKFPNRGIVTSCCFAAENREDLENIEGGAVKYESAGDRPEKPKQRTGASGGVAQTAEETDPVTVKNVIPGQRVRFAVRKKRGGKTEGQLLEVLEKSPLEKDVPDCPHFGVCGGCNYQTLPYAEQLNIKAGQVLELMQETVPDAADVFEGIKASPAQFGYRNKMEFTFGDAEKDGPLTLGMHKRDGFYDIVTVDRCRIVDEDYRRILTSTEAYFREMSTPFYHRMRHEGYLRHLLIRKAAKTGEILIVLITTTQACFSQINGNESTDEDGKRNFQRNISDNCRTEKDLLDGWRQRLFSLELHGKIAGILHTRNDSPADAVKNEGTQVLYGQDYFYEEILGLKFRIHPFGFYSTTPLVRNCLTTRKIITYSEP